MSQTLDAIFNRAIVRLESLGPSIAIDSFFFILLKKKDITLFGTVPIKIVVRFFAEVDKQILKFV